MDGPVTGGAGFAVPRPPAPALSMRHFEPRDEDEVLALLSATRGSAPSADDRRFFDWKHWDSPFGASPAWVAEADDRIVGFRIFMRWEFLRDGVVVRAVRAVDTATHPDYQGRGIFTKLTMHSLEELAADGVAFVFNTPNDKSRPGYLKMGWKVVTTLPVLARPRSLASAARLLGARVPAEKLSLPTSAGEPIQDVLSEREGVAELLASLAAGPGLATRQGPEYLSWRYGFEPLRYRALLVGHRVEQGLAVFRVRRRGSATEAAICEVLVPPAGRRAGRRLLGRILGASGADVAVRIGVPGEGSLTRLPGQGPTLVWRGVTDATMPEPGAWRLGLGDVELF